MLASTTTSNLVKKAASRMLSTSSGLNEVVIVSATRTPVGTFGGSLSSMSGSQLGAVAIKSAVDQAGIAPGDVQEVLMGNVVAAGAGQAPARQASMFAGLPEATVCTTVNKVCASGLKTAALGAQSIMLGAHDTVVTGGFESMSNIPYYLLNGRNGFRFGHNEVVDGIIKDGLWDVYNNIHMGSCAEDCAARYGITREDQDAYCLESYRRAKEAIASGAFKAEITPVEAPKGRKGTVTVDTDEEPTNLKEEKVPSLRPAFAKENGTVTAANASSLNDGASAMVLMSAQKAAERGLSPLARIRGFADAEQEPIQFTTAPSLAVPKAMAMAGVSDADVDLHEINEAFSVVALANMQVLGLDHSKVNVNGGAVSIGHPIGASGARILTTLVHALRARDKSVGVASICNGGGGASALVVEML